MHEATLSVFQLFKPRARRHTRGMEHLYRTLGLPPVWVLGLILFAFTLAGVVKGVIGMGLPTVAVGLLGLVMPPTEAAAILVVPSLVTNVWQLAAGPRFGGLARRLWPLLAGVCAGTWAGMWLFAGAGMGGATTALGIALIGYALFGLSAARFSVPARLERWLAPWIGASTGVVTAATGVFVVPTVPYLQALEMEREELIQALGLNFTVSTLALAGGLAHSGVLRTALAGSAVLALIAAVLGMLLGQVLRQRISPATFRRCFFGGLLLLGAHLSLRGLL
jgi:uncharacterized membrane protein YfcA